MGRWQQALTLYNEALTVDKNNKTVNAKLYFNKATVCAKLNQIKEAAEACTAALELDENYVKALLRRAKCYTELGDYEEAVKDYEKLYKIDKSKENKQLLHEAKLALKKSKRKDYYKILGIEKNASEDDIKKAYRYCICIKGIFILIFVLYHCKHNQIAITRMVNTSPLLRQTKRKIH